MTSGLHITRGGRFDQKNLNVHNQKYLPKNFLENLEEQIECGTVPKFVIGYNIIIRPKKKGFGWSNPTDPRYPADPRYFY